MEAVAKSSSQMHALKVTKILISPVVKSRGARFLDMVRQSNVPKIENLQTPAWDSSLKVTGEPKTPINKHKLNLPHEESKSQNKFNPKSSPTSSKRKVQGDTLNNSPSTSNSAKVCLTSS